MTDPRQRTMRQPLNHVRRRSRSIFNRTSRRLNEIGIVISARGSHYLEETDDVDLYLVPAAQCFYATVKAKAGIVTAGDMAERLKIWSHAKRISRKLLSEIAARVMDDPDLDSSDMIAARLHVSYAERESLKLFTIGAYDADKSTRTRRRKQRKRDRDRQRAAAKRKAQGATPHEQSLSRLKPWLSEGMSRTKWYLMKLKFRETDSVAP